MDGLESEDGKTLESEDDVTSESKYNVTSDSEDCETLNEESGSVHVLEDNTYQNWLKRPQMTPTRRGELNMTNTLSRVWMKLSINGFHFSLSISFQAAK